MWIHSKWILSNAGCKGYNLFLVWPFWPWGKNKILPFFRQIKLHIYSYQAADNELTSEFFTFPGFAENLVGTVFCKRQQRQTGAARNQTDEVRRPEAGDRKGGGSLGDIRSEAALHFHALLLRNGLMRRRNASGNAASINRQRESLLFLECSRGSKMWSWRSAHWLFVSWDPSLLPSLKHIWFSLWCQYLLKISH